VFYGDGKALASLSLGAAILRAEQLGAGELYLTSMERDGTGQGYDMETLRQASALCRLPIIASGGVGNFEHLLQGLELPNVSAASTANIFNFMSDGLTQARTFIEAHSVPLARWDFSQITAEMR
jgi:cyclase